jgi:hypothetical protein
MIHQNRRLVVLALAALALLLSCRALTGPLAVEGRTLLRDDFDDPNSGWSRVSEERGETNYLDGMYRILIKETQFDAWSLAGRSFSDVRVEADVFKVSSERSNRFGLICRAIRQDSFYTFIINSDGYYGVGKVDAGAYQLIGMAALQPSDAIQPGSALNHLRADCVGSKLTFYVNGVKLAQVTDTQFPTGDVGLIAGAYEIPGVDIRFDNFLVAQP